MNIICFGVFADTLACRLRDSIIPVTLTGGRSSVVERHVANVAVVGSSPIARSLFRFLKLRDISQYYSAPHRFGFM